VVLLPEADRAAGTYPFLLSSAGEQLPLRL